MTANAVGEERREGTLGLLLLTRVKILDVLVGKLGSVGVLGISALLAILPMMMIPVLAGGVTGGEAARKALVLLNVLFFAMTVGLYAASGQPERFKAARRAVLIVIAFALMPLVAEWTFRMGGGRRFLAWPSCIELLITASDTTYRADRGLYWIGLAVQICLSFLFLFRAGVCLRRSVREEASEEETKPPVAETSAMPPSPRRSWRSVEGKWTPAEWLVRRQRGLAAMLWTAGVVAFLYNAFFGLVLRFLGLGFAGSYTSMGLACSLIQATLLAWAASRFFLEARQSSELEILLTTPVGAGAIISAQWRVLKRGMRGPIVLMVAPLFLQAVAVSFSSYAPGGMPIFYISGAAILVLRVAAVFWLGIWFGLRAPSQSRAIVYTIGLAMVVPYLIQIVSSMGQRMFLVKAGSNAWLLGWLVPQMVDLLFFLWLIRFARRRLREEFVEGRAGARNWAIA